MAWFGRDYALARGTTTQAPRGLKPHLVGVIEQRFMKIEAAAGRETCGGWHLLPVPNHIRDHFRKKIDIVIDSPKRHIAFRAEQRTNFLSFMIVIDCQRNMRRIVLRITTNRTKPTLRFKHCSIGFVC